MYSPPSLYTPHQAFQGVKSSELYTEKYGSLTFLDKLKRAALIYAAITGHAHVCVCVT